MVKNLNILVVEDEDDHFELIRRSFEMRKDGGVEHKLERASSLGETISKLGRDHYDLILADWRLPDGEGLELLKQEAESQNEVVPVILMTSHGNEALAVDAMKLGALDYVVKSPEMMTEMARLTERAMREWSGRVERKNLEEQLRQSQKMESVGLLAGGIAHDFNNVLQAIIGYASLLQEKVAGTPELASYLDPILSSADRAANLTHQLLAFSRKQLLQMKPVDVNELVVNIEKLLRRVIGEDIEFGMNINAAPLTVLGDRGQLEQVLMNLASNARDAMPDGGFLSIETSEYEVTDSLVFSGIFEKPGRYAQISVADNGTGMDEQTRAKIFEPFYTTKEVGRGTGLGLSIVYGIIKQHGGEIHVYSEPAEGTTFKIYVPLIQAGAENSEESVSPPPRGGTETILLAEDSQEVRNIIKIILQNAGYKVIEAVDGDDAVVKFREHMNEIQLLFSDVMMPQRNGKDACDEIRKSRPDIKVIFISGYTADIIQKKGIIEDGTNFISKPVKPGELLRRVRTVFDAGN